MCILGGSSEINTPIGRIDLLTDDLIIECKHSSSTGDKHALGQVLSYKAYYPAHKPCVALIGRPAQAPFAEICEDLGVGYLIYWNNRWQIGRP